MARRSKKRRHRRETGISQRWDSSSFNQSEVPLLVFVSSVIDGMREERNMVERAMLSIPITRPWLFERAPASSQQVEEAYLSKVRQCDLFVLLLGLQYSEAVELEYETALQNGRPILTFIQEGEGDPRQQALVRSIRTKYKRFARASEVYDLVFISVLDEVIRRFRSTISNTDLPKLIQRLPTPIEPVRGLDEIADYVIVGMEQVEVGRILFTPFGVSAPPEDLGRAYPAFEPVFFDDLAEMNSVFDSLKRATAKASKAVGDRQAALWHALKEEAIGLASHYFVRRRTKQSAGPHVPGLKYLTWGVAPTWLA